MIKIAITGPIASGKSLVEKFFAQQGAVTLDTDKVAHKILENNQQVLEVFGTTDRKKLGEIVFSDNKKLKQLEKIVHPEVKHAVAAFFEENQDRKFVVVSVPLLYEAKMEGMFDFVVIITASEEIRLNRLVQNRALSEEEAKKRICAIKQPIRGDFVIENNETIENLQIKAHNIFIQIKERTG